MNRRLVVQPRALREIAEASGWYEAQVSGLGHKFLDALDEALRTIQENPTVYQVVSGELRRAPLHGFPYIVLYGESDGDVIVLTCIHSHRNPRHWPTQT
jgi:plasmid stabilization system protein ParE